MAPRIASSALVGGQHDDAGRRRRRGAPRAVAATPSRPGIRRSISTTSGRSSRGERDRLVAVGRRADHLDVARAVEQRDEPAAARSGGRRPPARGSRRPAAAAGARSRSSPPPAAADAPRAARRPARAGRASRRDRTRCRAAAGLEPAPSSRTARTTSPRRVGEPRDERDVAVRARVLAHVRERLLRAAQQHDLVSRGSVEPASTSTVDGDAGLAREPPPSRREGRRRGRRCRAPRARRRRRARGSRRARPAPRRSLEHGEAGGRVAGGRARRPGALAEHHEPGEALRDGVVHLAGEPLALGAVPASRSGPPPRPAPRAARRAACALGAGVARCDVIQRPSAMLNAATAPRRWRRVGACRATSRG